MTGYPWATGDALLAADLNAAIAYAGAGAEAINVRGFGAKGDGATDDTAAIKAAVAAGAGRTVYFPPGTYRVSGTPTVIPSHTRVVGAGREVSIIRPNGLTTLSWAGGADILQVFAGHLYAQLGPFASSPAPPGGVYDTDIAIEALGFDFTQQAATVASFLLTQRLSLAGLSLWSTAAACSGVRCISCDRVTMRDSIGDNVMQMLDCWGGATRLKVNNVDVTVFPGGGNGGAFNLQGVGNANDSWRSWQCEVTNVNVQLNVGTAFFLDSLGNGSITSDVLLENVVIVATGGATNWAIIGRGRGGRVKVHNMTCVAQSGASWSNPILIGGAFSSHAIETGPNKVATVSGSSTITVTFSGGTEVGVGNYVYFTSSVTGNGLTLLGAYRILTVVSSSGGSNLVVTANARANATATGTIAASTSIIGYIGSFHDCEFNGITFDGAQAAGQPIVGTAGYGHQFSNINVTTNYGASSTPQYTVAFATDASAEPDVTVRANYFQNITAAPGIGPIPSGSGGDTLISYNTATPRPAVGLTNPIGSGINFGSVVATSSTNLARHIDLFGGVHGLCIDPGGAFNIVANSLGISIYVSGTRSVVMLNTGLEATAIGSQFPTTGTFTSVTIGSTTGPTWTTGSAAPAATAPVGSLYSRVGGAVGATLYVSRGAGTWAAVAGV